MPNIEPIVAVPDPGRTIEGLRDTGYSFETAVADLIDNSIAAGCQQIAVLINMDFRGDIKLLIADNGCGMDREELIQAMTYGSPKRSDPASLGKFGLGLKTASTAFCRRLSVISRPSVKAPTLMATWDLDHVVEKKEWQLLMSNEPDDEALEQLDKVAPQKQGTVVLWNKVDRLLRIYNNPGGNPARTALRKHCTRLGEHIAMTYQRFLDTNDKRARNVRITVNGENIRPWDPFQTAFSELVAEEFIVAKPADAQFTIRAYVLPRREEFPNEERRRAAKLVSHMQGLYIYREQRLIHSADWLGMFQREPHVTLLRVEFSFDHKLDGAFQLDIKKSQIILNDELWKALKDQILAAPRREAIRRYREGRKKDISDKSREGVHDASNVSIRSKEAEIGGPKVNIQDPDTGDVTVDNAYGTTSLRLKISSASKPGEVFVQPADDVPDGFLFEPALIEQRKAVRINTRHPYYHKVYVPNYDRSVTVQGIDYLLWALCVAELSSTTDQTMEILEAMRFDISRTLRKLVEDLPEPDSIDNAD